MITIDDRIGSNHLAKILGQHGCPVVVKRLQFGDACFDGCGPGGRPVPVGVELKTVSDLVNSLVEKRLSGFQVPGLKRTYEQVYLIIEGEMRAAKDGILEVPQGLVWRPHRGNMLYRDLLSWLTTFEIQCGIHIRFSRSQADTGQHLFALFSWWQKAWEMHDSLRVIYQPTSDLSSGVQLRPPSFLQQVSAVIPGIGWSKSAAVANHFGNMRVLANAEVRDWAEVMYRQRRKDGSAVATHVAGKEVATRITRLIKGDAK